MHTLSEIFERNRKWAELIKSGDPDFFHNLSRQQSPEYLWIGCADSRVPATQITDLEPGEIFVHRNIANVVVHTDLNCLSVIQFAVDVLQVKHIIVCGHYGCGGVKAALAKQQNGLIDNWLHHIRDVHRLHQEKFVSLDSEQERLDLLCRLNVREQVVHVCETSIVQNAWNHNQKLTVHGWIYRIENGILDDLEIHVNGNDDLSRLIG